MNETITVRLTSAQRARLEEYAKEHALTLSQAIRYLIEQIPLKKPQVTK